MSDAQHTYRLRPHHRIKQSSDFRRVYDKQEAFHAAVVVLFYRPNDLPFSRLGVSVGRKHGNAVKRNRIKRVFREAFRFTRKKLPAGYDFVLIPRRGVSKYGTDIVLDALTRLGRKIPLIGEHTRSACSRVGDQREETKAPVEQKSSDRRGISRRVFPKRAKRKP